MEPVTETIPDRIEKTTLLRAPPSRVWRAISDARRFGTWFGVEFEAPFSAGSTLKGKIVPTKVDPDVAKMQEPYDGFPFEITVERIEPERLFSFRWHPFAIDKKVDYSSEPTTLIELTLTPAAGGTRLTITESGFSRIPLARRAVAFLANDSGWAGQTKLIEKYLVLHEHDA
jgi:uncharacterized protein YndB with AHSA1/START domain